MSLQPGPDAPEQPSSAGKKFDSVNQTLGRLWSRFWAIVVGLAGCGMLYLAFVMENATIGSYAFVLGIALVLFLIARSLWTSKDGLLEIVLDEEPPRHQE